MGFGDGVIAAIERKKAATHMLMQNWAGVLESEARAEAPWTDRTGHARQGLHAGVDVRGPEFILWLAHSMQYGHWLEVGTGLFGPHHQAYAIKPKNRQALSWPGASHPVRSVTHPGMRPQAIIVPTLEGAIDRIRRSVLDLWGE